MVIFWISTFCWWKPKISHSFGKICKCIWNILSSLFRKCYALILRLKNTGFRYCWLCNFFLYFYPQYTNGNSNKDYYVLNQPCHFLKDFKKIFQMHLCPILKCTWKYCYQQKNIWKMSHFWYLIMTILHNFGRVFMW